MNYLVKNKFIDHSAVSTRQRNSHMLSMAFIVCCNGFHGLRMVLKFAFLWISFALNGFHVSLWVAIIHNSSSARPLHVLEGFHALFICFHVLFYGTDRFFNCVQWVSLFIWIFNSILLQNLPAQPLDLKMLRTQMLWMVWVWTHQWLPQILKNNLLSHRHSCHLCSVRRTPCMVLVEHFLPTII